MYYEGELGRNITNLKKTWDLIRSSLNLNSKSKCFTSKLRIDESSYNDPFIIACKFNEFFTTMPSKIANSIPIHDPNFINPLLTATLDENVNIFSFTNSPVTGSEVLETFKQLKNKKT